MDKEIVDTTASIAQMNNEIAKLPITQLDYSLARLTAIQSTLEGMNSFHDAQGTDNLASSYIDLIKNGYKQINIWEQQNKLLAQQQKGLDKQSERWQELQGQIDSNNQSILAMKTNMEGWNDSILQTQIDALQKQREELQKENEVLQTKKNLNEALEDLQKARTQRTKLIYRQGVGYVYQADREALKSAQDKYDDAYHASVLKKIDVAIDAIESSKETDNVWNYDANELLKNLQHYSNEFIPDNGASEIAQQLINAIAAQTTSALMGADKTVTSGNISINIGDISLKGVNDVNGLANAIISQLPSILVQKLYQ